MMRIACFLMTVVWMMGGTAAPASPAFDRAMAGLDRIMADGGDPDRIYKYLTETVQTSRAIGRSDADFAIFYAMLADHIRNVQYNPVRALQVAEEGLELIAGDPSQSDYSTVLQVTRSYALADLGRLDEAYAQAQLILPAYRGLFDAAFADDYAADAANWGRGELSEFNTAATELARKTLKRAYALMDEGAYGRVLSLTSTALLPLGTGLAEGEVRGINTEAEMLMARALDALGRDAQAGNAWLRALGYMTETPWDLQAQPRWWGGGLADDGARQVAFDIFEGLAGTAGLMGLTQIERAALAQADPLAATARARYSTLLRRARLAITGGDMAAGQHLLAEALAVAQEAGNTLDVRVAQFYIALFRAREVARDTGVVPAEEIVATAQAALAEYRRNAIAEADFIYESAARLLLESTARDVALDYARQALSIRKGRIAARGDSAYGQQAARRDAAEVVELFLTAAHGLASDGGDGRLQVTGCDDARAYMGCVIQPR